MNRKESISALARSGVVDLVVIGGGATGLGVALDAALRGHRVVLLESHDFAGGTSSRSTKLLHGGVRYLAQGNISLVREALHERAAILNIAPHVSSPLAFVMPAYSAWKVPFYGIGLKIYDLLAGAAGLGSTQILSKQETLTLLPGVKAEGLFGGVKYWDAQFDDTRLALAVARSAMLAGAQLLNYVKVDALEPLSDQIDGARWAVAWRDQRAEESGELRAKCVVNAAGVWVDDVLAKVQGVTKRRRMVTPSQGVHLVVDRAFLAGESALLVPKTKDGRVLFAVPWLGAVVLGTTDTVRADAPREPVAFEEEIEFILREAANVLTRAPSRADVKSVWVGLRPLVNPTREKATRAISREHTIEQSQAGLITVTGGKWTTYRAMAEDVLNEIHTEGLLPQRESKKTACHRLMGASGAVTKRMTDAPGIHLFGDQSTSVLSLCGADREVGMGLTEAMIRYSARYEFALTVEDVLARRWRALFLDARQALEMADRVAEILTEETAQDPELEAFQTLCRQYQLSV